MRTLLLAAVWAAVACVAAVGAYLVSRGPAWPGWILVTIAVLATVLVVFGRWTPDPAARRVLRDLAKDEIQVAGSTMGLSAGQMREAFANRRTIAELATEERVPVESVISAIVGDVSARLDAAVASGHFDERFAARVRTQLPMWTNQLITFRTRRG